MKYSELSSKWQKEAVKMEVNFYQQCVNELARENEVKPWTITAESDEVKEALEANHYEIEKDIITDKEKLVRVYD